MSAACECRALNTPPRPGEIVMCDACLADEICRLDRYYADDASLRTAVEKLATQLEGGRASGTPYSEGARDVALSVAAGLRAALASSLPGPAPAAVLGMKVQEAPGLPPSVEVMLCDCWKPGEDRSGEPLCVHERIAQQRLDARPSPNPHSIHCQLTPGDDPLCVCQVKAPSAPPPATPRPEETRGLPDRIPTPSQPPGMTPRERAEKVCRAFGILPVDGEQWPAQVRNAIEAAIVAAAPPCPVDLGELERLEKEATRGPWTEDSGPTANPHYFAGMSPWSFVREQAAADARLIVALRNALPALLAWARAVERREP